MFCISPSCITPINNNDWGYIIVTVELFSLNTVTIAFPLCGDKCWSIKHEAFWRCCKPTIAQMDGWERGCKCRYWSTDNSLSLAWRSLITLTGGKSSHLNRLSEERRGKEKSPFLAPYLSPKVNNSIEKSSPTPWYHPSESDLQILEEPLGVPDQAT